MTKRMTQDLPIVELLPALRAQLDTRDELVLEAPPGAGKTTQVQLALLDAPWLRGQKVLMLEPRRLAARGAAERMAALLGEPVGQTVGYRVRLESKVSAQTRIEVITEGILTRLLQDDPSLEGVGLLIFDEFHERSLDADLGLALALEGRRLFGELRDTPLKILLMSATLNGEALCAFLDDAPLLSSEGRQYPVTLHYQRQPARGRQGAKDIVTEVCAAVQAACNVHAGSLLVFLPGQGEIRRCAAQLEGQLDASTDIAPLYGNLSLDAQRLAIAASPEGRRKVVLATNIAESSLTIDGIEVVIDSGLERRMSFDPRSATSRLATQRISAASAAQRAGRAGRLGPGHCYRLWTESEQSELPEQGRPEILDSDLGALCLQCLQWGSEPEGLRWLDPPPAAHCRQAMDLLTTLGAIENGAQLSARGRAMAALPLPPRLAALLLSSEQLGCVEDAAALAALLGERDPEMDRGADIHPRLLAIARGDKRYGRIAQQARQYRRLLPRVSREEVDETALMVAAALAFPDRIARAQSDGGTDYQLSNGRRAVLAEHDSLRGSPYLLVLDLGGHSGQRSDRIHLACRLDSALFSSALDALVSEQLVADWDEKLGRFVAERQRWIGKLILDRQPQPQLNAAQRTSALLGLLRRRGLSLLNWSDSAEQLRGRVALMRRYDCAPGGWPVLDDESLLDRIEDWLLPYLTGVKNLRDLQALDMHNILMATLDWPQQQALQKQVPERLAVPSGSQIRLDYRESPPVLAVKLQEMFGCEASPQVAEGQQTVLVHLLSPAQRPLAVTADLAGFWRNAYHDVKKEMKGRYPKHPWPDDPLSATATAYTKARQQRQGT